MTYLKLMQFLAHENDIVIMVVYCTFQHGCRLKFHANLPCYNAKPFGYADAITSLSGYQD